MILQSLSSYYERIVTAPESTLPTDGYSAERVHFALVLSQSGELVQGIDLRELSGKRKIPRIVNVPQGPKKSVNIDASFLWGNTSYVLGYDDKGKPLRTAKCHSAFKRLHESLLSASKDEGAQALLRFLALWRPQTTKALANWEEMLKGTLVFRLDGDRSFLHDRPAIREIWNTHFSEIENNRIGSCLISGETAPISRLHPAIKWTGAPSSRAALVSFNLEAFCSYGKKQNFNAPISEKRAAAYTKALNHLLTSDRNRIQVADATIIFWTERDSPIESIFGMVLDPRNVAAGDDKELAVFLETVAQGRLPREYDPDIRFYILGLSPNAARLSVRFWHVSTVKDISEKLGQHFRDLDMVKSFDNDPEHPGIWRLLNETTNRKSKDGPSPLLAGAVMRSVLTGALYPQALLAAVVGRIRADHTINYMRAAIIKAVLVRKSRILNRQLEVPMALDKENKTPAYLLGRLFAVLEKAQQDAIPNANTTIKDRFYGAASATPRVVFPQLIRLAQHWVEKAEYGRSRDRLIEEIVCDMREFPAHLGLDDQGLFAIGYYHQRQDFFKRTTKQENKEV